MNRKMREQQAREKRQLELEMIAFLEAIADPVYTSRAAGFWLERQAQGEQRAWA